MPILNIHLAENCFNVSAVQKLISLCSDAFAAGLGCPVDRVRVFVTEHKPAFYCVGGKFVSDGAVPAPAFSFMVLEGRPLEDRQNLMRTFTDIIVETLNVPRESVRGGVVPMPPENWSVGGVPASVLRQSEIEARRKAAEQQATASFDERAKIWDNDPMKTARAQAVADAILANIGQTEGLRGFEYGCGTGLLSFCLQKHLQHITLADSSIGMLDVLREKIAATGFTNMAPIQLDLTTDPLPAERFDIAYSLMTFHHIPDTDTILRDLHALLSPAGHLCIADLDSEDGSFHSYEFHGHKGFDRTDLARRAEAAGFRNIRFSTVFTVRKGQPEREYPVFLMIAEKNETTNEATDD